MSITALSKLLVACSLLLSIAILLFAAIHDDTGYIIPTANLVARGAVWNPELWAYHASAVIWLLGLAVWAVRQFGIDNVPYEAFLSAQILVFSVSALVVAVGLRLRQVSVEGAFAGFAITLSTLLLSGGQFLMLDGFAVLPALCAVLIFAICPTRHYLVGALLAVAFLCRQYCFAGTVGIVSAVLVGGDPHGRIRALLRLGIGFFSVFLFYLSLNVGLRSHAPIYWITSILGGGYRWDWQFQQFLGKIILILPFFLGAFFLSVHEYFRKLWQKKHIAVGDLAITITAATFLLCGFVRPYLHYFQLAIPFVVLCVVRELECGTLKHKTFLGRTLFHRFTVGSMVVSIVYALGVSHALWSSDLRKKAYANRDLVCPNIPPNARTLNVTQPVWTYLCNLNPANYQKGFSFLENHSKREIFESRDLATFLLMDPRAHHGALITADGLVPYSQLIDGRFRRIHSFPQAQVEIWLNESSQYD